MTTTVRQRTHNIISPLDLYTYGRTYLQDRLRGMPGNVEHALDIIECAKIGRSIVLPLDSHNICDHPDIKAFGLYLQKYNNIVERYCGPMPAMRDAQMMLFYAACTGHLKSSTDGIISRVVSDHNMLTRCRENFASMMDILRQRISRRVDMLGEYTLQSMKSANTRDRHTNAILSALVTLLITPSPLCANSIDCSGCIFTCLQRLQHHRNTMFACLEYGSDQHRKNTPNLYNVHYVFNVSPGTRVHTLMTLLTRNKDSLQNMMRLLLLHMKTLGKILQ